MARECPRCGTDNPSAARFCRRCGREMQMRISNPPPIPLPPVHRRSGFPLIRLLLIVAIVLFWISLMRGHRRPPRPHYYHGPVEVPTVPAPRPPFRHP